MLGAFRDNLSRAVYSIEDGIFQLRHGLNLGEIICNEHLESDYSENLPHATAYQAVWCRNLREIFAEIDKTSLSFENFIDIGSGKGKACFYASLRRKYRSVIGIDFSPPLVRAANENKCKFSNSSINFEVMDASTYSLPDHDNLIFMFNPFDKIVLEKFLVLNIPHFENRKSLIAYANDVHRFTLTKLGFDTVFRNQTRKISIFEFKGNS